MADEGHSTFDSFSRLARIGATRGGDVNGLLRELCELAAETLPFDRAVIYRLLPSGDVVPVVSAGERPPLEAAGGLMWTLEDRPLFRRALESRGVVVVDGAGEDPVLPKELAAAEGRSLALAPLFGHEHCLGFLAGDDGHFEAAAVARIGAFAALAGAFLEQALERERLARLGDLKSHFIALASHELRAPVAVIHGIGATLDAHRQKLELDEVARLHGILHEQTERLAHLVNQLLDLSRLEANAITLERREIAVRDRVADVVRTVAGDRAPLVEVAVEPDLRTVVDPNGFDRIVSNLIANAFHYGSPPVRVTAVQRDTHFRLVVEDRGDGVSSDFVPRLFEKFARAGGAEAGGTGLGLAIAQSYANAHGGELLYAAAEPNGARFELVLPRPHPA